MKGKCLRAVAATKQSITISWQSLEGSSLETPRQLSEDRRSSSSLSDRSTSKNLEEDSMQMSFDDGKKHVFVLQIKDKILDWKNVYSGYKTQVEVKGLKPGECFQFRLKRVASGEDWSDCLFAATKDEPVPSRQLFRAIQNSHAANTKRIIAQRPSILNTPNNYSQSPLEFAVSSNDGNMVNLLLSNGADIARTEIGSWRTPLMIAAFRGHLDIVKILTEKGCSWEDKDRNGMTALHYAADNSHLEIVKFAVEEGADVTVKDIFGWSPLMRAVTLKASSDVIEYLLDNGGDANEADGKNQTLLMQAVLSGRPDIVKMVISKNADTSIKNIYGHSAYQMAVNSPYKEMRRIAHTFGSDEEKEKSEKKPRRHQPS